MMSVTSSTHARQVAELVLGALDAHGGDRGALERGQQHAAQGVADGAAVAGLEGLGDELGIGRGGRGFVLDDELGHLEPVQSGTHVFFLPVPGVGRNVWRGLSVGSYFEYSSTMSCSLTIGAISSRVGTCSDLGLEFGLVHGQPGGPAAAFGRVEVRLGIVAAALASRAWTTSPGFTL